MRCTWHLMSPPYLMCGCVAGIASLANMNALWIPASGELNS